MDNFTTIAYSYVQNTCFYKESYSKDYWRDGRRVGFKKADLINQGDYELTAELLSSITRYECIGIYDYFYNNNNEKWENILLLNPFGKDLVFEAFFIYWIKRDRILNHDDINNYPEQKEKFIKYNLNYYEDGDFKIDILVNFSGLQATDFIDYDGIEYDIDDTHDD
jgi:hypothetical protein